MHDSSPEGPVRRWLSTIPVLVLLGGTALHWMAQEASGQLISVGESIWPGYAIHLRVKAEEPAPAPAAEATPQPGAGTDDALIGDLLGADAAPAAAPAPPAPGAADDALIGDLLGADAAPAEAPAAPAAPPAPGAADDALIGDLLGADAAAPAPDGAAPTPEVAPTPEAAPTPEVAPTPEAAPPEMTAAAAVYRQVDYAISTFAVWGATRYPFVLVLLLLVAGATATVTRGHISLRPVRTVLDDRVSHGVQLLAHGAVVASMLSMFQLQQASGTEVEHPGLPLWWAAAFGAMAALNLAGLVRPAAGLAPGGSLGLAALTVPLHATMTLVAMAWFVVGESYLGGVAVYLEKLTEHAELYIYVGLYVWTGMLLKRTAVAHQSFGLLRPWKLPPELMAAVIAFVSAVPTAYSGASGIFVIAVGGLIYDELRRAGARPQLALATTAMSGSLGVVLRPCLLVVIVAYLNPPTTDTLYGWGKWVFLLTSGLFAGAVMLTRRGPLRIAPVGEALAGSVAAARGMLPALGVGALVLGGFGLLLNTHLDEHTAPVLLPAALLAMMVVERLRGGNPVPPESGGRVLAATRETSGHIGALVLLMAMSIALGGVFERSEVMAAVPADLGSPWLAMGLLVVVLVVIGMLMDPYGAVILVSATIAQVATANGIHEAHFWMVVLVAFELGYLTPPVALNHLLTRQVVGVAAVEEAESFPPGASFWARHESVLLPVTVMGIALLVVAFGPLAWGVRAAP